MSSSDTSVATHEHHLRARSQYSVQDADAQTQSPRVRLSLSIACAACGPHSSGPGGSKRRLSIATGGTGGVFYPYGGGIAKVITEHLPNTEATAEVTAASVDNLKFLKQGNSDLAFTMADMAQDAVTGRDVFSDFGTVPVRTLAVLYSSYSHLVAQRRRGNLWHRRPSRTRRLDGRGRIGNDGDRPSHAAGRRARSRAATSASRASALRNRSMRSRTARSTRSSGTADCRQRRSSTSSTRRA